MGSIISKVKKSSKPAKAAEPAKQATPSPGPSTPEPVEPQETRTLSKDGRYVLPSPKIFTFTSKLHHDTYPEINPVTQSDCTGKAVLVTGSNRGIGRAILISYAKAGATRLALCSRDPAANTHVADEIRAAAKDAGRSVVPEVLELRLDVTDQAQVDAAAKEVEEKWGRLDVLVNNAGFMAEDGFEPLGTAKREDWELTLEVSVIGAAKVTRALLPIMLKGGDKTVVNMSSIGALYAEGGAEAYGIAKMIQCRAAEFLCAGYAKEDFFAFSVHPAGIDTPLARRMPEDFHQYLCDKEELPSDSIVYLTSKRPTWLGGRFVNLNWDMPELLAKEKEIVAGDLLKFKCQGLF
ncbi:hypothetical protein jhhlp_004543 [Lomentospora prolificans]|uniref:Ketoreductase domain-containing protein n=1 Tax=Lomentospora prolificans TaxID=41688 RepID=A0A2N3NBV4_9PEZI|nr:hypothetical protein jhhlp_004543 [Lomentospora prolificans]